MKTDSPEFHVNGCANVYVLDWKIKTEYKTTDALVDHVDS